MTTSRFHHVVLLFAAISATLAGGAVSQYTYYDMDGNETCPTTKNLGDELSESNLYDGPFPAVSSVQSPIGYDDGISVLVGGDYTWTNGAEVEGKLVVLGNFNIEQEGGPVGTLGNAGVGSGIVPPGGSTVLIVGGNFTTRKAIDVMPFSELGGNVSIGGSFTTIGAGKLRVPYGNFISVYTEIDFPRYILMIRELAAKAFFWATLKPNGIVIPAKRSPHENEIIFMAGDDEGLQVFHADYDDLRGPGYVVNVRFDESLADKTVLINVRSTTKNGKKVFENPLWGDVIDTYGNVGEHFNSTMIANTVWNFYDADEVTLGPQGGPQLPGSIVVPKGNMNYNYPGSSGRVVVAGDLTQDKEGLEFHNFEFDPRWDLPLPPCGNQVPPVGNDEVPPAGNGEVPPDGNGEVPPVQNDEAVPFGNETDQDWEQELDISDVPEIEVIAIEGSCVCQPSSGFVFTRLWEIIGNFTDLDVMLEFNSGFAPFVTSLKGFQRYTAAKTGNSSTVLFMTQFDTEEHALLAQQVEMSFVSGSRLNGEIAVKEVTGDNLVFHFEEGDCVTTSSVGSYLDTSLYNKFFLTPDIKNSTLNVTDERAGTLAVELLLLYEIPETSEWAEEVEFVVASNDTVTVVQDMPENVLVSTTSGEIMFDYLCAAGGDDVSDTSNDVPGTSNLRSPTSAATYSGPSLAAAHVIFVTLALRLFFL